MVIAPKKRQSRKYPDCFFWSFQLSSPFRAKGEKSPRHKLVKHLGTFLIKGGKTERYRKRIFFNQLPKKLKPLGLSNRQIVEIARRIRIRLPAEASFHFFDFVPSDYRVLYLQYAKYLKNHSETQLFQRLAKEWESSTNGRLWHAKQALIMGRKEGMYVNDIVVKILGPELIKKLQKNA